MASRVGSSVAGRRLACCTITRATVISIRASGRRLLQLDEHRVCRRLARVLAAVHLRVEPADLGGLVKIWDAAGNELRTLPGHGVAISGIQFSADGRQLASAGMGSTWGGFVGIGVR